MSALAPPSDSNHEKDDPGAHELNESSDDHFSDASEGQQAHGIKPSTSPVPITRVERVDEEPSHGEVPGTAAYKMRTQDAVPDEIEVVPEGMRSRSASRVAEMDRPHTPGGTMIPKTIVEKVEPDKPSHGEVPGTEAYEKRRADADPDEIITSPIKTRQNLEAFDRSGEGEPTTHRSDSASENGEPGEAVEGHVDRPPDPVKDDVAEDEDGDDEREEEGEDGFGDDFDDFEEGEEVEGDDFGDFGETEEASPPPTPGIDQPQAQIDPLADLPNFEINPKHSADDIGTDMAPYLAALFPDTDLSTLGIPSEEPQSDALLSDRSSSLWSQLVAPPPLQPPNWIRSRIRRLFLVSLGVPVDLDEILPASKQKKLVLPSIHLNGDSPRVSNQLSRTLQGNASSTSVATTDSKGEPKRERKKKAPPPRAGPAPPPKFDANAASRICGTTQEALTSLSDGDLKGHVETLRETIEQANKLLEYWVQRKDSALGDKEAFEGVIENLVGFAAKAKARR